MNDAKEVLKTFLKKIEKVPDSPYSMLIYVGTVLFLTSPLFLLNMFANICFFNIFVAGLAVLIPYKFYKEDNIKKLAVAGLISILLVSVVGTVYHVNELYTQEPGELSSDNLTQGTVNRLYGDTDTVFNFTVESSEAVSDLNYSVYLNISYLGANNSFSEPLVDSYEMKKMNDSAVGNSYFKTLTVEEKLYEHYFSLKINRTGNVTWEETEKGYGPLTIPQTQAYIVIFPPRAVSPLLLYALGISLIWWRKKMVDSQRYSTSGLEKKEEALESYCDNCGTLLSSDEEVCPECGEPVKIEEDEHETTNDEDEDKTQELS